MTTQLARRPRRYVRVGFREWVAGETALWLARREGRRSVRRRARARTGRYAPMMAASVSTPNDLPSTVGLGNVMSSGLTRGSATNRSSAAADTPVACCPHIIRHARTDEERARIREAIGDERRRGHLAVVPLLLHSLRPCPALQTREQR